MYEKNHTLSQWQMSREEDVETDGQCDEQINHQRGLPEGANVCVGIPQSDQVVDHPCELGAT
jgi:hypothetical protein